MARSVWTQNINNIQELMQQFPNILDFWTQKGHEIKVADITSINIQSVNGALGGIDGFIKIKAQDDIEIRYSCRDIIKGHPIIDTTFKSNKIGESHDVSNDFQADLFTTMTEKAAQLELRGRSKEAQH